MDNPAKMNNDVYYINQRPDMATPADAEIEFAAAVRRRTGRAFALLLDGLASEVWVPASVVRLEKPGEEFAIYPYRAFIRRWWALKEDRVRHLLAKRVAGLPAQAGLFQVRPAAPPPRPVPGPVEELVVRPLHEFASTRAQADLSLEEVAALLGLDKITVSKLEDGQFSFTEEGMWERAMAAMDEEGARRERISARLATLVDRRATRN